jgi:hypothetical protein
MTYDAVTEEYTAYIADETLTRLELSDVEYKNVFRGTINLQLSGENPIPIPSVSPIANIISYSSSAPEINFEFYKDGADNYYAKPTSSWYYWQGVTLTIITSAPDFYYFDGISPTLTLEQIPDEVKHTPSASVRAAADIVITELGLTGETNVQTIVETMKQYFNSFTAGDIP